MADLITLQQYKTAEGITQPKDDARLNALIPSVSQLVKTYCGNSFVDFFSSNKTETFTLDWGTYIVQLTESPVNSIISVQERQSYSDSYATLTTGAYEYALDSGTDSVLRTLSSGRYKNWPLGVDAVKVVYTAGYSAIPADLKLAVLDLVTYYLKDEHKQRQTIAGASLQNQGSTSQNNNVSFPDHIKRVLDLYKNF
ncbi:MAG: phage head-tail connector protein [Candidatus Poseidoniales archaeon]|nr:phage head-tail connector protein [Candidatus Poseidoniales archaeon]